MAVALAHFKVQDYDKWLVAFRAGAAMRAAGGCKGVHIFYNSDDKTDIIINFNFEDRAKAEAMLAEPATIEAQQGAGVIGRPELTWVEDGGREPS